MTPNLEFDYVYEPTKSEYPRSTKVFTQREYERLTEAKEIVKRLEKRLALDSVEVAIMSRNPSVDASHKTLFEATPRFSAKCMARLLYGSRDMNPPDGHINLRKANDDVINWLIPDMILPSKSDGMYAEDNMFVAYPTQFMDSVIQTPLHAPAIVGGSHHPIKYFRRAQTRVFTKSVNKATGAAVKRNIWHLYHLIPWNLNYMKPGELCQSGESGHWVTILADPMSQSFCIYDSLSWDVTEEPYTTVLNMISRWFDLCTGKEHVTWEVQNMFCFKQSDGLACGWATILHMIYLMDGMPLPKEMPVPVPVTWFCKQILEYIMKNCVVFTIY